MATVNLSKVPRVNLTKGQTVSLTKDSTDNTAGLGQIYFGAKWGSIVRGQQPVKGGFLKRLFTRASNALAEASVEDVDLDASLLLYDDKCKCVEAVYFGQKMSSDGAIKHSGDDLTGTAGSERDQDNEVISINLPKITSKVKYIVASLNSYRHHKFDEIPYMKLRIYTGKVGKPEEILCAYDVQNNESFKGKEAIVLGHFYRTAAGWKFQADGTTSSERSLPEIGQGSALNIVRAHAKEGQPASVQ